MSGRPLPWCSSLHTATPESSAPHAHPSTEDYDDTVEAHYSGLERLRPHACTDGLVFLTYTVFDEAVGEEVERLEVVPCRRCAERGARA